MTKINWLSAIAVLLVVFANASFAATSVSVIYKNYPVKGNNIHEIRQSILVSGVSDQHGNVFAANISPRITWKYNFAKTNEICTIKSVDVEVEITYKLPRLVNYEALNSADKQEWSRYYNATFAHEQGHANLSIQLAKEIEWEAVNIAPKNSCGAIRRTANMLVSNILNRLERNNLTYDAQTAHGITQGARFASAE